MLEFRRISECTNPMEVLSAPMEVGLIDENAEWPWKWSDSLGPELKIGEAIEVVINPDTDEVESLSEMQRSEWWSKFEGVLGRKTIRLQETGLALLYSTLAKSAVGLRPCDLAKIIEARLSKRLNSSFSVSVENLSDHRERDLKSDDTIKVTVELAPISPELDSEEKKRRESNFAEILGSKTMRVQEPGCALLYSILEKSAAGLRPCDLAYLIESRLAEDLSYSFSVSVNRLSDLSRFADNQTDLTDDRSEIFDRSCIALETLNDEFGETEHFTLEEATSRIDKKAKDQYRAWVAVRSRFPGADYVAAMVTYEAELLSKMELRPEVRRKFSYLSCALSQGYRPSKSPQALLEEGEGHPIPAHFVRAVASKIRSPKWSTPDILDKEHVVIRGQEDRPSGATAEAILKRIPKRSLYAWPKLLFHAISENIEHEIEISKAAREKGLVPPREIYRRFSRLAYGEFCRAYDQVCIMNQVPIKQGSDGQWMAPG